MRTRPCAGSEATTPAGASRSLSLNHSSPSWKRRQHHLLGSRGVEVTGARFAERGKRCCWFWGRCVQQDPSQGLARRRREPSSWESVRDITERCRLTAGLQRARGKRSVSTTQPRGHPKSQGSIRKPAGWVLSRLGAFTWSKSAPTESVPAETDGKAGLWDRQGRRPRAWQRQAQPRRGHWCRGDAHGPPLVFPPCVHSHLQ